MYTILRNKNENPVYINLRFMKAFLHTLDLIKSKTYMSSAFLHSTSSENMIYELEVTIFGK